MNVLDKLMLSAAVAMLCMPAGPLTVIDDISRSDAAPGGRVCDMGFSPTWHASPYLLATRAPRGPACGTMYPAHLEVRNTNVERNVRCIENANAAIAAQGPYPNASVAATTLGRLCFTDPHSLSSTCVARADIAIMSCGSGLMAAGNYAYMLAPAPHGLCGRACIQSASVPPPPSPPPQSPAPPSPPPEPSPPPLQTALVGQWVGDLASFSAQSWCSPYVGEANITLDVAPLVCGLQCQPVGARIAAPYAVVRAWDGSPIQLRTLSFVDVDGFPPVAIALASSADGGQTWTYLGSPGCIDSTPYACWGGHCNYTFSKPGGPLVLDAAFTAAQHTTLAFVVIYAPTTHATVHGLSINGVGVDFVDVPQPPTAPPQPTPPQPAEYSFPPYPPYPPYPAGPDAPAAQTQGTPVSAPPPRPLSPPAVPWAPPVPGLPTRIIKIQSSPVYAPPPPFGPLEEAVFELRSSGSPSVSELASQSSAVLSALRASLGGTVAQFGFTVMADSRSVLVTCMFDPAGDVAPAALALSLDENLADEGLLLSVYRVTIGGVSWSPPSAGSMRLETARLLLLLASTSMAAAAAVSAIALARPRRRPQRRPLAL